MAGRELAGGRLGSVGVAGVRIGGGGRRRFLGHAVGAHWLLAAAGERKGESDDGGADKQGGSQKGHELRASKWWSRRISTGKRKSCVVELDLRLLGGSAAALMGHGTAAT
jgi:hypothetical protein